MNCISIARFRLIRPFALFCACFPLFARAADIVWTNTSGGNWSAAANWLPNQVPGPTDNVFFTNDGAYLVTMASPVTISNLTLTVAGCVVTGNVTVTIQGDLNWSAGTIAGNDNTLQTTVSGTATLGGGSGGITLDKRVLRLLGQSQLKTTLRLPNYGRVRNEAGARCSITNGAYIVGGVIENLGTLWLLPGLNGWGVPSVQNFGTVEATNCIGDMFFNQSSTGAVLRLNNANLVYSYMQIQGGTLTGNGTLQDPHIGAGFQGLPSTMTGTFIMRNLWLDNSGIASFQIGGAGAGMFDHWTSSNSATMGNSRLEVKFANGFQNSIRNSDTFEVLTLLANYVQAQFSNVAWGGRLTTADGFGSFRVTTNTSRTILLSDYIASFPFLLGGIAGTNLYPFASCYPAEVATLGIAPGTNVSWTGGRLEVQIGSAFDPSQDSLGIRNEGEAAGQIGVGPVSPGSSGPIRFGGIQFANFSSSASGLLRCDFDANANTTAIQALLRNILYSNSVFSVALFTDPVFRFLDRTIEFNLTDGLGLQKKLTNTVLFPYVTGLECSPLVVAVDPDNDADIAVLEVFYGGLTDLVRFPYQMSTTCPRSIALVQPVGPSVHVKAQQGGGSGLYDVSVQAGPFNAAAQISVNDSCAVGALRIFAGIYGGAPPGPAGQPKAQAAEAFSLATYRALEGLMSQTAQGQHLRDLYWRHSRELIHLISTNGPLVLQAADLMQSFQPAVTALLSGTGSNLVVSTAMVDALNSVWNQITNVASDSLRADMEQERSIYHDFQDFVGHDFNQWAQNLSLQIPTSPWFFLSAPALTANGFSAEANAVPGWTPSLWWTPDLLNWQPVPDSMIETNGTLLLTHTNISASGALYQIRATHN